MSADNVVDAVGELLAACARYEQGQRRTEQHPALTLLGESEIQDFFGTIPTLSDATLGLLIASANNEKLRRERTVAEEQIAFFQ